ncbi:LysR family transcriptional regulator [Salinisphaera orenii MK-B5]|uniref:LysR family transcriptional regulator n=1 Tax=Salinisphaera orenii MK-B5 TaxID=856730 RepID=A0A423PGB3_9GAMM|nr:hydrogen peroxide-inducible genes activator [Salinisphaera orenii]ROO24620.1 LysR family transcriptional regulator [Salinisphaera orenii MK-B5]
MHITLTELRYLIALDKERHFGRAARRAFVSQPTLSVAVKKLESELGVTVFERSRGEARVTPIGRRIIEQAYRVLGEVSSLEAVAEQGRDELKGPLRLGVIYTVGPYLLPHLIPRLREATPDMPLVIEENFTGTLTQQLRNNELDAVIVAMPYDVPGLSTWALYDESFVVVMPQNHPWTARDEIDANDLAGEDLLLLGPGHCFRDQVLDICAECRDAERDRQTQAGSSLETIRHMVASGLGITVLPRSSIPGLSEESRLLETRPFAGESPTRRIAVAWRKSFPRPRAITALREAVMRCEPGGVRLLTDATASNLEDEIALEG